MGTPAAEENSNPRNCRRCCSNEEVVSRLRIVTAAARRAALFPELFPIPDSIGYLMGERETDLVREHADLAAVAAFLGPSRQSLHFP